MRYYTVLFLAAVSLVPACDKLAGLYPLGEPAEYFRLLPLTVSQRNSAVVFDADYEFSAVSCACKEAGLVWLARCPESTACTRSATYGDPHLNSEIGPQPLIPDRCYNCEVASKGGRGIAQFSLTAEGKVSPCPSPP